MKNPRQARDDREVRHAWFWSSHTLLQWSFPDPADNGELFHIVVNLLPPAIDIAGVRDATLGGVTLSEQMFDTGSSDGFIAVNLFDEDLDYHD
jgi:hypothetical protein